MLKIGVIAGEISGDLLGASLMKGIKQTGRPVAFTGVGGEAMQAEGLASLFPMQEIAVMGVSAVIQTLPLLLRRIKQTAQHFIDTPVDVLVIIDAPDFTHRVAKRVRQAHPKQKIIDYVCPSVWAWRPKRALTMAKTMDHVLALLPFEPNAMKSLGGPPTTYVGHPLLSTPEKWQPTNEDAAARDSTEPVLLLMPGSRRSEVERLMPIFGDVVGRLAVAFPNLKPILPAVPHVRERIDAHLASWPILPHVVTGEEAKWQAIRQARAALAASGTVTLELALAGVPMVIAYKVNFLEYQLRHLIKVANVGLPNLILQTQAFPECLQHACTSDNLTAALTPLLGQTEQRNQQIKACREVREKMTPKEAPNSSMNQVVEIVLSMAADKEK